MRHILGRDSPLCKFLEIRRDMLYSGKCETLFSVKEAKDVGGRMEVSRIEAGIYVKAK